MYEALHPFGGWFSTTVWFLLGFLFQYVAIGCVPLLRMFLTCRLNFTYSGKQGIIKELTSSGKSSANPQARVVSPRWRTHGEGGRQKQNGSRMVVPWRETEGKQEQQISPRDSPIPWAAAAATQFSTVMASGYSSCVWLFFIK